MENFEDKIFGPASLGHQAAYYFFDEKYIRDLDLSNEELKMKILDIGGGDGNFASKVGDNVVTVDIDAHNYLQHSNLVVTAKAEELPFDNEAFELVISSQALPVMYGLGLKDKQELVDYIPSMNDPFSHVWVDEVVNDTKEDVEEKTNKFIDEVLRVLKVGGKAKFAPVYLISGEFYGEHFEMLLKILKGKVSKMDYRLIQLDGYKNVPGEIEVFRLEITKK